MTGRVRGAARTGAAVLVAAGAAAAGLAAGATPPRPVAAACSAAELAGDPALAHSGYVQAAYRAWCPGAVGTGITLGLYRYPRSAGGSVLLAQTGCTADGASIECRISAPCSSGRWDVTVGTDAEWPVGTAAADFGWAPQGKEWSIATCPRYVPGLQSLALGVAP